MPTEKLKLCVFDMAGTLVQDNNQVQKFFIAAFKQSGLKIDPAMVNDVMGYEKKFAIDKLLAPPDSITPGAIKIHNKTVSDIYKAFNLGMINYYHTHAKPAVYANTALKKIKGSNIKIALNTGFGKKIMKTIITALQWDEMIDACISSDQVSQGRPYPFMIERLKNKTKVMLSTQVAKIGDTPSDLLEGYYAGCALNIGICSKNFPHIELKKYPHTHLVRSLKEATSIVLAHHASV